MVDDGNMVVPEVTTPGTNRAFTIPLAQWNGTGNLQDDVVYPWRIPAEAPWGISSDWSTEPRWFI